MTGPTEDDPEEALSHSEILARLKRALDNSASTRQEIEGLMRDLETRKRLDAPASPKKPTSGRKKRRK